MGVAVCERGERMKFLDLFAGIGGFRMGLESLGHECVGFCEIDKFARKSYKAIYDTEGEIELHDITEVTNEEWRKLRGTVDIICGGFPCQAFSIAGKRKGFLDETRGTLFFEIARAAKEIKPPLLFLENVKGLLSHDKGRTFRTILSTLDELGYDAEWQILNSKDYGVPQNRERVFIIGHLRGECTRAVFPIRGESAEIPIKIVGNADPRRKIGSRTLVYDKTGLMGALCASDYKEPKLIKGGSLEGKYISSSAVYSPKGLAPKLTTMQGGGLDPKVAMPVLTPDRVNKRQNGRRVKNNGEPMFTLTAQDSHGVMVSTSSLLASGNKGAVAEDLKSCDEVAQVAKNVEKYANTIRPNANPIVRITSKNDIRGARQDSKKTGLSELQFTNPCNPCGTVIASNVPKTWDKELRIRRLTPRECWRLQGFPDWAFDKAQEVNSNSQLYKQAGNSVTVNVIKAIAERL